MRKVGVDVDETWQAGEVAKIKAAWRECRCFAYALYPTTIECHDDISGDGAVSNIDEPAALDCGESLRASKRDDHLSAGGNTGE